MNRLTIESDHEGHIYTQDRIFRNKSAEYAIAYMRYAIAKIQFFFEICPLMMYDAIF